MDDGVRRKLHFTILKYEYEYFNMYIRREIQISIKHNSYHLGAGTGYILLIFSCLSRFVNIDILIVLNMSHGRKGVITLICGNNNLHHHLLLSAAASTRLLIFLI